MVGALAMVGLFFTGSIAGTVSGELKLWHKVTITFDGPSSNETSSNNPFTNYRLNVTFVNGSTSYTVPGFYAADGNAGESSAISGNKWRVHFAPDKIGTWTYTVSFHQGTDIAVSLDAAAGTSANYMDNETGAFTIGASDKTGRDFRGKGRLRYVGEHFLKFAGTGEWFVKGGADAPENFLNYEDFDGTPANSKTKSWSPHATDWKSSDPSWKSGKGTEIIGAINYLSSKGMNAFSFSTYGGDDLSVFPWLSYTDYRHFDCSKLDQWEIVFAHADKIGMYLHFKTQEAENSNTINSGALGTERKIYYRELIARFGHHLALNWNMGEENLQTVLNQTAQAQYVHDIDPFDHHIVLHNAGSFEVRFLPYIGNLSQVTGLSIQTWWDSVHVCTKEMVTASVAAGKKWVVANDEQNGADVGVPPDGDTRQPGIRIETLWGNLMAGGAGVEYYFGYQVACSDLTCQDYRSRDQMWTWTKYALDFFNTYIPFWEMSCDDNLVSGSENWCLKKAGDVYVVYLKKGGTTSLNLSGVSGTFSVRWFDPRNGGSLATGSVTTVIGGGTVALGNAPNNSTSDWAVLATRQGYTLPGLGIALSPASVSFTVNQGASNPEQIVTVTKRSSEALPALQTSADASWIQATITGSGESQLLKVAANLSGLASGIYNGSVTVTGGSLPPSVIPVTLRINGTPRAETVSITPSSASVRPGATQQFTASVLDQYGVEMASASIVWSASYGSISANGLYQAPSFTGSAKIIALVQGTAIADTAAISLATSKTSTFYLRGMDGTLANGMAASTVAGSLAPQVILGSNATGSSGTLPNSAVNSVATFTIDVTAGHWYAWARLNAADDNSNSYWIQVDGGTAMRLGNNQTFNSWVWENNQGVSIDLGSLTAGIHTISISAREAGCKLDMICLTPNLSFIPTDFSTSLNGPINHHASLGFKISEPSVAQVFSLAGKLMGTFSICKGLPAGDGFNKLPGGIYIMKTVQKCRMLVLPVR